MKLYVLSCSIERHICEPQIFLDYESAKEKMIDEFFDAAGYETIEDFEKDYDDESAECWINDWCAWCESKHHDNCDWRIHEVEV